MRQGKDTAVQAIIKARNGKYDIRRYGFADAVKEEYTEACKEAGSAWDLMQGMRVTHNLPDWVQYDFAAPMDDPLCPYGKQRTFLQWWGTEYRRAQDSCYWVRSLAKKIDKDKPQFALLSDVRFPNEAAFVKLAGGFTVKVTRAGYTNPSDHPSEHMLDGYEFDFQLNGVDGDRAGLEGLAVSFFDWLVECLDPKPGECVGLKKAA